MTKTPAHCDPELFCRECGVKPRQNRGLCKYCNREKVRAWEISNPERSRASKAKWQRRLRKTQPAKAMWRATKTRARKIGVPFTITLSDIQIPDRCPVFDTPMFLAEGCGKDCSPSLDRLVPALGYVPGNVCVISKKANTIKNSGDLAALVAVWHWLRHVEAQGVDPVLDLYVERELLPAKRVSGSREPRSLTKQRYYSKNLHKVMWRSARSRADKKGIPFLITPSDISIPRVCPALGAPLERARGRGGSDVSLSLDRIIPELGYVPGNIAVISSKANRIKHNSTSAEIGLVAKWLEGRLGL